MFRMKSPTSGFMLQSATTRTRSRGLTRAFVSSVKTCYSLIMQIKNYRKNCGATSIPPAKTWTDGSEKSSSPSPPAPKQSTGVYAIIRTSRTNTQTLFTRAANYSCMNCGKQWAIKHSFKCCINIIRHINFKS